MAELHFNNPNKDETVDFDDAGRKLLAGLNLQG